MRAQSKAKATAIRLILLRFHRVDSTQGVCGSALLDVFLRKRLHAGTRGTRQRWDRSHAAPSPIEKPEQESIAAPVSDGAVLEQDPRPHANASDRAAARALRGVRAALFARRWAARRARRRRRRGDAVGSLPRGVRR